MSMTDDPFNTQQNNDIDSSFDSGFEGVIDRTTIPKAPKPPGRRKEGRRVTTTTRQEEILGDSPDNTPENLSEGLPLFPSMPGDSEGRKPRRVDIYRLEPHEGFLGSMEPDATERHILEKWGGSFYRLEAKNNHGKIIQVRSIKIAGDPVFVSEQFDITYRRKMGLPPRETPNKPGSPGGFDIQTYMAMLNEQENKRRDEEERREVIRKREERESEERRRKLEDETLEKRRRDEREFEERRRRDDQEREERTRKASAEDTARAQSHFQMMIQMVQAQSNQMLTLLTASNTQQLETLKAANQGSNGTNSILQGVELVQKIKEMTGDGEQGEKSILSTVIENLPGILNSAGGAVGRAARELKGEPQTPPQAATPNPNEPQPLTLQGPLATKYGKLIQKWISEGKDPALELSKLADNRLAPIPQDANSTPKVETKTELKVEPNKEINQEAKQTEKKPNITILEVKKRVQND